MDKPELDYAFLAEYAAVQDRKLTAVGASYTYLLSDMFPFQHQVYVGGRIRKPVNWGDIELSLRFTTPDEKLSIVLDGIVRQEEGLIPYDGKVGLIFVGSFFAPLAAPGLYRIDLLLEGEPVRRLAFEASFNHPTHG